MSLISSYETTLVENDSITIVIAHADNDRKKKCLLECIDNIKTEKVVVSNYPIDNDIQTKSDWILYTDKNEILLQDDFKKYSVEYWYNWRWPDGSITYMTAKKEAGYACYDLIRKGLSFCKGLGKKKIHVINYDYVIPNEVLIENEKLLNQNDLIFYRNGAHQIHIQDEYSTGFFSGDIDVLLEFFTHYKTKEQYYTESRKTNRELFLEGKMKSFYDNNPHSIFTKTWQDVPDGTLIDREKFLPSREEFWEEKLKQENEVNRTGIDEMYSNKDIHIYYHVCTENDGLIIAAQQLHLMSISGLLYNAKSVNVGLKYDTLEKKDEFTHLLNGYNLSNNIKILFSEKNVKEDTSNNSVDVYLMGNKTENFDQSQFWEKTALFFKHYADSITNDEYIFYLHTKGISRYKKPEEVNTRLWRQYMEYFMVNKWKECVKKLDEGFESCGTFSHDIASHQTILNEWFGSNLEVEYNSGKKFYPGTFFWMNTSLIKKIPERYFYTETGYKRWSIEALPGIVKHEQYVFHVPDPPNIVPYSKAIYPLSYIDLKKPK